MGNVMVNNHNHSPDLVCLFWFPRLTSSETAQLEILRPRDCGLALEEAPLGTYTKQTRRFRGLNLANLSNEVTTALQLDCAAVCRRRALKKFMVVSNMIIHPKAFHSSGEILFQFAHRIRTFSKEALFGS